MSLIPVLGLITLFNMPLLLKSWELDYTKELEYLIQLNQFKLERVIIEEWAVNKYSPAYWRRSSKGALTTFIQYLDLEFYHIAMVEHDTFAGFDRLKFLSLGNNRLTSLNGAVFKKMSQLDRLILRNNQMGSLDGHMLNDLESLRYLDLENNRIAAISNGFVKKFNKLCVTDFLFFGNKCIMRTVSKLQVFQDFFTGKREFRSCVRIKSTNCNVV